MKWYLFTFGLLALVSTSGESFAQLPSVDWAKENHSYSINPKSGMAPLTVTVSLSTQIGQIPRKRLFINWGDGSCSNQGATSHTYRDPGNYAISIRCSGPSDCRAPGMIIDSTDMVTVGDPNINNPERYFVNCIEQSSNNLRLDKKTQKKPLEVGLYANIKNPQCLEYFLDWGDGSLEKKGFTPGPRSVLPATTKSFKHVYKEGGKYTIRFRSNNDEPYKHAKDILYFEKLDISI